MFDGESRRAKIMLAAGLLTALFLFLFMQAVGGLIDSGGDAQPDLGAGLIGRARDVASTTGTITTKHGGPAQGTCTVSRGPLPDTTCTPTAAQVSAATGIPIPPVVQNFTSLYEQFQDWRLEASFVVTDPSPYLSLPDFPGVKVGGGPVQSSQASDGSYRSLELTSQNNATLVKVTAFTT
jgi:hypothetical protein